MGTDAYQCVYGCVCSDLGNRPMGGMVGEGYTGLVIESCTVIGHWTQTMGGLKRI